MGQLPGPGGGPSFLPSEDLQERLYLNRSLLTAISAQRVLPFEDNICLREPCENYMRCVSVPRALYRLLLSALPAYPPRMGSALPLPARLASRVTTSRRRWTSATRGPVAPTGRVL